MSAFLEFTYHSAKSAVRLYFEPLRWVGEFFSESFIETDPTKMSEDWGTEPDVVVYITTRRGSSEQVIAHGPQSIVVINGPEQAGDAFRHLQSLIDEVDAPEEEKDEAKRLLSRFLSHPLVIKVLAEVFSKRPLCLKSLPLALYSSSRGGS